MTTPEQGGAAPTPTLALSFEPIHVPEGHPPFLTAFAAAVDNLYRRDLVNGARTDYGITPDGWKIHSLLEYTINFGERTTLTAEVPETVTALPSGAFELTRECSPLQPHNESMSKDEFLLTWLALDEAMGKIAPFALSGSEKEPDGLLRDESSLFTILPQPNTPPAVFYHNTASALAVVYRPLEEVVREDGGRGRRFEERVYSMREITPDTDLLNGTDGLAATLTGQTVIKHIPPYTSKS